MLGVGGLHHDLVHFGGQFQAIHVAGIKPAEMGVLFQLGYHVSNPTILLPCGFIVGAHGFDSPKMVHPGGGVAAGTGWDQFTVSTNGAGAGFDGLEGPGLGTKLGGFGELVCHHGLDYGGWIGNGNHFGNT